MHGARPAEHDQRELARVVAALMVTRRIWSAMRAFTTRWMPAAAATRSTPIRRPIASTARSAAATSSVIAPPANRAGFR